MKDLGSETKIKIHLDATAAIGIARRKGMGKIRHLDVSDLWVQDKVRNCAMNLVKIDGPRIPLMLTKYVDAGMLHRSMRAMGLELRDVRPEASPEEME